MLWMDIGLNSHENKARADYGKSRESSGKSPIPQHNLLAIRVLVLRIFYSNKLIFVVLNRGFGIKTKGFKWGKK